MDWATVESHDEALRRIETLWLFRPARGHYPRILKTLPAIRSTDLDAYYRQSASSGTSSMGRTRL